MKRLPVNLSGLQIPTGEVVIDKEKCKGCHFCIEFCPKDVLDMSPEFNAKGYHFPILIEGKENDCTGCGYCELTCPDFAIFARQKTRPVTEKDVILT